MKRVLVAASFEKGRGTGHIVRGARLVSGLREKGIEASLCPVGDWAWHDIERVVPDFDRQNLIVFSLIQSIAWDFIITDRFQTPPWELALYRTLAPVLGIDEGGRARRRFDFLLDILRYGGGHLPNERFLFPAAADADGGGGEEERPLKALVVFGGEDRAELGEKTCLKLLGIPDLMFTVVTKNAPLPNLARHLGAFQLVITHYGITAYEALAAGVPVLLVHPTILHRRLAAKAGFWSLEKMPRAGCAAWITAVLAPHCTELAARHIAKDRNQTLTSYIAALSPRVHRRCPACGKPIERIIARFAKRTYRRCPACGMVVMDRLDKPPVEYAEKYFFDDYKEQYGKTYIEDFEHLKEMGKERAAHILSLLDAPPLTDKNPRAPAVQLKLLDAGCAYGPFLQAAKEAGFFLPIGFDPSKSAVQYVKEKLGIYALHGFFPADCRIEGRASFWEADYFDALTMWYVIEHITSLKEALEKAAVLLKPGGVFAFSTPSASGISALRSQKDFLEKSPADHWTIWPPREVKALLGQYGFSVKKVLIKGHHPERFPWWARPLSKASRSTLSAAFSLGDTFEVYAVKTVGKH